jgi:hypothetical protein
MEFDIRHRISELEEEIYHFEVSNNFIRYRGIWFSKRRSLNEPFGYDWQEYYEEALNSELKAFEEKFGDDIYNQDNPNHYLINDIKDKYNPVLPMHKLLSGTFSSNVAEDHPLKISEEFVKNILIEKIKQMKVI